MGQEQSRFSQSFAPYVLLTMIDDSTNNVEALYPTLHALICVIGTMVAIKAMWSIEVDASRFK
jgi:hypothetical protein